MVEEGEDIRRLVLGLLDSFLEESDVTMAVLLRYIDSLDESRLDVVFEDDSDVEAAEPQDSEGNDVKSAFRRMIVRWEAKKSSEWLWWTLVTPSQTMRTQKLSAWTLRVSSSMKMSQAQCRSNLVVLTRRMTKTTGASPPTSYPSWKVRNAQKT